MQPFLVGAMLSKLSGLSSGLQSSMQVTWSLGHGVPRITAVAGAGRRRFALCGRILRFSNKDAEVEFLKAWLGCKKVATAAKAKGQKM